MTAKELSEILKVCRKFGVETIELGDLKLTLSDTAKDSKSKRRRAASPSVNVAPAVSDKPISEESWEGLSVEERLFWSSTGQVVPSGTEAA